MSAESVINTLKRCGQIVIGCDIYPASWHYEATLCDKFIQAPFATDSKYIDFLLKVIDDYHVDALIPLTDLEIDVINAHRAQFANSNVVLCMQQPQVLSICRNKYSLNKFFEDDSLVPTIPTCIMSNVDLCLSFPCVIKPVNGRSSEGLLKDVQKDDMQRYIGRDDLIIQEQKAGRLFTVDYCRDGKHDIDCAIPREELLRTKNGAGLTVRVCNNKDLIKLTSHIGHALNINGGVNMEFILCDNRYYLIDINPRYSAGVAFSEVAGYNIVLNSLRVYLPSCLSGNMERQIKIRDRIIVKKYNEVVVE